MIFTPIQFDPLLYIHNHIAFYCCFASCSTGFLEQLFSVYFVRSCVSHNGTFSGPTYAAEQNEGKRRCSRRGMEAQKQKKKKQHEIGGQLNVVKWGQTLEGIQDFSGSLARLMLISNCVNVGFRFLHTHTGRSLWPLEMQTGKKATNLNICPLQHAPSLPHTHTHTYKKKSRWPERNIGKTVICNKHQLLLEQRESGTSRGCRTPAGREAQDVGQKGTGSLLLRRLINW